MRYNSGEYDVIVVGAGHAGCEAALASARLGMKTLVATMSLESIAMMPCNPNVGGTAKGHLVREIDALGGEMGKNIDKSYVQLKMLNTSKGPAVHSLRAQADRKRYQAEMKHILEKQENLEIKQGEIVEIKVEDRKIKSIETNVGAIYNVKTVIVATGTYLKGKIFIGEFSQESGPDGVSAANKLSESLKNIGIELKKAIEPVVSIEHLLDESAKVMGDMTDDAFFRMEYKEFMKYMDKAIEAHKTWLTNLKKMVDNKTIITMQFDAKKCGFGHFYYSMTPKTPEIREIWINLEEKHKKFHFYPVENLCKSGILNRGENALVFSKLELDFTALQRHWRR